MKTVLFFVLQTYTLVTNARDLSTTNNIDGSKTEELFQRLELMESLNISSEVDSNKETMAQDTLGKYTKLAVELGLIEIKDELEDLSFGFLCPVERSRILSKVAAIFDIPGQNTLNLLLENLRRLLSSNGLHPFQIRGRQKAPFAIWQKMKRQNIQLERVLDIFGFRVIVDSIPNCYFTIHILHSFFPPINGTFDDYILHPNHGWYQSLHTSIIGPFRKPIEIQVRTEEMDRVIEPTGKAYWQHKTKFNLTICSK